MVLWPTGFGGEVLRVRTGPATTPAALIPLAIWWRWSARSMPPRAPRAARGTVAWRVCERPPTYHRARLVSTPGMMATTPRNARIGYGTRRDTARPASPKTSSTRRRARPPGGTCTASPGRRRSARPRRLRRRHQRRGLAGTVEPETVRLTARPPRLQVLIRTTLCRRRRPLLRPLARARAQPLAAPTPSRPSPC